MSALYLTPAELAAAPTGINWATLFAGANQPTAGQLWYCQAASGLVDNIVGEQVYNGATRPYVLRATTDTEIGNTHDARKAYIGSEGNLVFVVSYRPIVNVISGLWRVLAGNGMTGTNNATPLDLANTYWEGREITLLGTMNMYRSTPLEVTVTYVDGFANALLTGGAAAGTASLALDDATGIVPSQELILYDMPPEQVVVSAAFVPTTGPATVQLTGGLAYAHAAGIRCSALTPDLQQACLFLVQHLVQTKAQMGAGAARQVAGKGAVPYGVTNYLEYARDLLNNYIITP